VFNDLLRRFKSEEDVRSSIIYYIETVNIFKSIDLKKEAAKAANEAVRKKDGTLWKGKTINVKGSSLIFDSTGEYEITARLY
jgi:hypothetical protein